MLPIKLRNDTLTADDQAFFGMVWTSSKLMSLVGQRLQRAHSLSLSWFEVLFWLRNADGGVSVSDLGQVTMLSRSQVSRALEALSVRGLVVRSPSASDARSVQVAITEQGLELYEEADRTRRECLASAFTTKLAKRDINDLIRITHKLKQ